MNDLSRLSLIFGLAALGFVLPACGDDADDTADTAADAAVEAETVDGEGCEHQAEGPAVAVTAAVDAAGADAAAIDDDHHRYDVAFVDLAAGQKGGSVTFAADADGEFHFFFDTAVTYEVLDASGAPVARESTVASTEKCDVVHQWDVYDLSVGTYTLTFAPSDAAGVKIVVENAGAAHDHTHE